MSRYLYVLQFLTIFVVCQHEVVARPPLKIVNGTDAEDGEFPYMVALHTGGEFQCGGSIIDQEWILTAAHCIPYRGVIDEIVYGTILMQGYDPKNVIKVKASFQHPKFSIFADLLYYDVGLLQLEEPIPLDEKAQIIKIPEVNEEVPFHVDGYICGWGGKSMSDYDVPILQKQQLSLLTDQECTEKVNVPGYDGFNATHHLCTDDYYNGICYGDSGSPYVINGTQYAITSWSYAPCARGPGVFARVSNPEYREWIKNISGI